jgi:hypothetical protein
LFEPTSMLNMWRTLEEVVSSYTTDMSVTKVMLSVSAFGGDKPRDRG